MTVLTYPEGKLLDWGKVRKDPNRVKRMVQWDRRTIYGQVVRGSLFAIASLDDMNRRSLAKYGVFVSVIQPSYNDDIYISQGTHDLDYAVDWWIPGVSGYEQQRFARFECGWCDWYRQPWQGFSQHQHGFPMPPGGHHFPTPVGIYVDGHGGTTSSQLEDYWHEAYGLKDMHYQSADPSPFPTDTEKFRLIFDLDRYIIRQLEDTMEYRDWSDESKKECVGDIVKRLLDVETVLLKKTGESDKKIPIRNALQRVLNDER